MRNKLFAAAVMGASALSLAAVPVTVEAQSKRVLVCDKSVKKKANNGTLVGAVAGGVLGNVVAGNGAKTEGTVLGAGVGAVVGHQVAKKNAKKKQNCHYEYVRR
ncbi:glycine zipper 2TM domain-containing protein [Phenylobacterium sp.]|uniref:glycine zipper 2TM domain-containing protein n=1 Tax=Phenylobacterium sp. TaxID=1871053 RepID=UPI002F94CC9D